MYVDTAKANTVYKVSVKNFSTDPASGTTGGGKYSAFTETGATVNSAGELVSGIDYLKELGELAEINEPIRETYYKGNERIDEVTPKYALLSTHAGRRTFICNALALGIPAQVVMKWTGHSDYKAMKPYIDIADDIKANAMNKFNQL